MSYKPYWLGAKSDFINCTNFFLEEKKIYGILQLNNPEMIISPWKEQNTAQPAMQLEYFKFLKLYFVFLNKDRASIWNTRFSI